MKLLENNIDLVLSSIEWSLTIENEKQSIQDYVDQVAEYFPDGVSATEVMENLPDELPYSTQLKTLIELAKQKLLTLGVTDYKPSPMEVLKIYGNPKHTAEKAQFNLNELESNKLQQLILEELQNYNTDELEEGWKDILPAAAIAAGTMFGGGAKAQASKAPVQMQQQKSTDQIEVNLGAIFKSGRYKFAKEDKELITEKLKQIQTFINAHPNSNFQIEIISSESQVPNRDIDAGTNIKMKTGELAQRRADSSKSMIDKFINNAKNSGQLKGNVNIKTSTMVGKTPFKQGDNPSDLKFTKEQFTNIIIKALASSPAQQPQVKPNIQSKQNDEDKFKGYNKINEPFYDDRGHLVGYVWRKNLERFGNSKQDTIVNYNVGRQDIIFQMTNDWGEDLGTYYAPMEWFNKLRTHPTTRSFSDKDLQQLKSGKFN